MFLNGCSAAVPVFLWSQEKQYSEILCRLSTPIFIGLPSLKVIDKARQHRPSLGKLL